MTLSFILLVEAGLRNTSAEQIQDQQRGLSRENSDIDPGAVGLLGSCGYSVSPLGVLTADAGDTGRETVAWEASIADISAVPADSSALEAESAGTESRG